MGHYAGEIVPHSRRSDMCRSEKEVSLGNDVTLKIRCPLYLGIHEDGVHRVRLNHHLFSDRAELTWPVTEEEEAYEFVRRD